MPGVDALIGRCRAEIAPGAVHVPDWLSPARQRQLVRACRAWARPPLGMERIRLPGGGLMSVRTVCLGRRWRPYRYTDEPVEPLPQWLAELGRAAVAQTLGGPYEPDVALVNFYDDAATMGMHQDRDERAAAPVVSLSLGDACVFRFGNTATRARPWSDVRLESGDLFVFGGPSRLAFHGVRRILPGTGPHDLIQGRLNITLRQSGQGLSGGLP
ncbi:alpha-ketoglutarate-dependent dioxygenase AlkB family protein [Streptosporangium roseum]|uniref:Alkylated DNA repair protein n=1 Tax=Streptosporangium roseum (strain ATCC 12428 / DSM 43021 / JCM 3005 / KCTC 9067 / NCIMB 10171 / NRRL 2505 / NI 9100) TaxID=479432 RepID=D2B1L1_STRRD|nr:alkylated DNA repair protein [Streptosporangium roseum DSM 43021]